LRAKSATGAPIDFSRYEGMSGDRFVLRSMTDEIMYELMALSGQEYVDVYAARAKAAPADSIAAAEPDMLIDRDPELYQDGEPRAPLGAPDGAAAVAEPAGTVAPKAGDTPDGGTPDGGTPDGGTPDGSASALAS
jgi:1-acyl-sn-glycerol-3-phosphate acyltransferase